MGIFGEVGRAHGTLEYPHMEGQRFHQTIRHSPSNTEPRSATSPADIAAATIRRILAAPQLQPWRHHLWLYPKHPRDNDFYAAVADVIDLYTRPLHDDEIVLSLDEKTSLQPRPRRAP